MSLRAIKKQQINHNSTSNRQTLFKKSPRKQREDSVRSNVPTINSETTCQFGKQIVLHGRFTHSNPELNRRLSDIGLYRSVKRVRSENDIHTLLSENSGYTAGNLGIFGAKSEVCLQTISTHNYCIKKGQDDNSSTSQTRKAFTATTMMTTSHRDLSYGGQQHPLRDTPMQQRRLSESSLNSAYSQRLGAKSTSSNCHSEHSDSTPMIGISGYEVIEERARFTVYKLRVENPLSNDCWLVLRRYTDFVRLNNKLKQAFPHINLVLPRKKIFGDNFNSVFLDNRVHGLQIFINSVMARDELRKYKFVREFFCLDEPPSYSDSMEECRAIFEAQEETISHLKMQINSKNDLILNLQQKLHDEVLEKEQLKETLRKMETCSHCSAYKGSIPDDYNEKK